MKILGLIPARGGSKGVPGKNSKLLAGKPLISYTIETALESKLLTDVVISSDCDKILKIAEYYNCIFLKRSKKNSQDISKIESVIHEVLNQLNTYYDLIVLLQPTAPIRNSKDIDAVINMFLLNIKLECVVSLVELKDIHPARMYTLANNDKMLPLNKDFEKKRRQELPSVFLRNGSIYAVKTNSFLSDGILIRENKVGYIMPESMWVNIDTEKDFLIAEFMVNEWKKKKK